MEQKRILVAYASRYGSTEEIAECIGETLQDMRIDVDIANVMDVRDISKYDGVVIGSPIYMGKWLIEAMDFVQGFRGQLSLVPVAVFSSGFSIKDDNDASRRMADAAVSALRPYVQPQIAGLFAGKLNIDMLSEADRQIIVMAKPGNGDFRNRDAIQDWARGLEKIFAAVGDC